MRASDMDKQQMGRRGGGVEEEVGQGRAGMKRTRAFWIEQLLKENGEKAEVEEEGAKSGGGTRAKRSRKGKEGGHGEEERMRGAADSPPLDEANWLRANENSPRLGELQCELENWETWEQFDQLGTEMIITKSGRRMFPVLRLRLYGTRPGFLYFIYLDLVPIQREHRFRYAYNKSQWQSAGKADRSQFGRLYLHVDSPFSGEQLAQPGYVVSFDKAKLTNNPNTQNHDQLLLNSMHKYRPRVHVVCVPRGHPMSADPLKEFCTKADLDRLAGFDYKTFIFLRTTFVAVTAYQNQLVTQKKIELNPFAKGFRDQKADNGTDESRAKCLLIDPPPPPASSSTIVPPDPPSDSASLFSSHPSPALSIHPAANFLPATLPWPWPTLLHFLLAAKQQRRGGGGEVPLVDGADEEEEGGQGGEEEGKRMEEESVKNEGRRKGMDDENREKNAGIEREEKRHSLAKVPVE